MLDPVQLPVDLRAHHHWRTDWDLGRTCLYWYLTFEDAPDLGDLVDDLAPVFDDRSWLHRVPREWLHLTVREVGFSDEVDAAELHRITTTAEQAREHLPLRVELGPVTTMTDAVVLPALPTPGLLAVHERLGGAPEHLFEPFWPHVTIGYLAQDRHRDDVLRAFGGATGPLHDVRARLTLAAVRRLPSHYQWRPLGVLG